MTKKAQDEDAPAASDVHYTLVALELRTFQQNGSDNIRDFASFCFYVKTNQKDGKVEIACTNDNRFRGASYHSGLKYNLKNKGCLFITDTTFWPEENNGKTVSHYNSLTVEGNLLSSQSVV